MGKWIDQVEPNDPVGEVAHRAVAARLYEAWRRVRPAALQAEVELERVHDLRVAMRRADAALRLFKPWIPGRRRRWFKARIRQLRDAAAEARDCDVLAARLEGWRDEWGDSLLAGPLTELRMARAGAQAPIVELYHKLAAKRFKRRIRQLLGQMQKRRRKARAVESPLALAARDLLRPLAERFFAEAAGDLHDAAALHQFRIRGKQVRYAMELLVGGFDLEFREQLYPLVEDLQERLGEINDLTAALAHFPAWIDAATDEQERRGLEALRDAQQELHEDRLREFLEWWTPDRVDQWRRRFDQKLAGDPADPDAAAAPEPPLESVLADRGEPHPQSGS